MKHFNPLVFFLLIPLALTACRNSGNVKTEKEASLFYAQDFDTENALDDFIFTSPSQWGLVEDGKGGFFLEILEQNNYTPKVRTPYNICLLKDYSFESFVVEVDFMQIPLEHECSGTDDCMKCGHRDMAFFWAYQDPEHFYYVHIALRKDDIAHNVFIVNGKDRSPVTKERTMGVDWGGNRWHHVRVERDAGTGWVKVFFDGSITPVLTARDTVFHTGHIGFGSFDERGRIDNIRVNASGVVEKNAVPFLLKQ